MVSEAKEARMVEGRMIVIDWYENSYHNQRHELVAKSKWSVTRVDRGKAKEKGEYSAIQLPYPVADLQ